MAGNLLGQFTELISFIEILLSLSFHAPHHRDPPRLKFRDARWFYCWAYLKHFLRLCLLQFWMPSISAFIDRYLFLQTSIFELRDYWKFIVIFLSKLALLTALLWFRPSDTSHVLWFCVRIFRNFVLNFTPSLIDRVKLCFFINVQDWPHKFLFFSKDKRCLKLVSRSQRMVSRSHRMPIVKGIFL